MGLSSVTATLLISLQLYTSVSATPVIEERQTSLPTGWVPFGCFSDNTVSRTLKIASFSDVTNMTIESCIAFCQPQGFTFAGVEFSRECFCDNAIESPGAQIADSTCNMPCTGNSGEICGGSGAISIFGNTAGPKIKQQVGTYNYVGCYQDGVNGAPRSLQHQLTVAGGMSAESCTSACKAAGFVLAGLEFGQECWCDIYFPSPVLVPDSDCNLVCTGDNTELCGAGNRLAIYEDTSVPPVADVDCLTCAQLRATTTNGFGSITFNLTAQPRTSLGSVPIATPTSLAPFQIAADGPLAVVGGPVTSQNLTTFTGSQRLTTFDLGCSTQGQFQVLDARSASTGERAVAVHPASGQPLQLLEGGFFPPQGSARFCAQRNEFSKSTHIGPPLLGIDELSNQWGFCPLSTPFPDGNDHVVVFEFEDQQAVLCTPLSLEITLIQS